MAARRAMMTAAGSVPLTRARLQASQRCPAQGFAVLPLQFGVQVGVHLVDDGGELVDQLPHRQRGFPSFQDEEDRSEVALDVPARRCRRWSAWTWVSRVPCSTCWVTDETLGGSRRPVATCGSLLLVCSLHGLAGCGPG